jgi:integrase
MPETAGSEFCQVRSFERYINKLHPSCDRLWQRPKDEFDDSDDSWYCNAPLGEKILGTFMTNLSKKYKLSEVYTNHSIRATGATILAKNMYYNAQIMAVTGHIFVPALSMYQRVDDEDEIRMGKTLTDNAL